MAWKNGRQLSSVTTGGTTTTYTYDATGVRDSKTVDGVKYTFYTSNGQVGRQYGNGKYWTFFYDNQGRPNALIYDGAVYYYVLNLQGDVIGIVNTSGAYVAQYAYDAWGKVISKSGDLADVNPLRYRGYYYDSETGFYYLGSRYYDPNIKRFINADVETVPLASNITISDKNLFAYCDNNPVMRSDNRGEAWNIVVGAVIGGGISAAITFADEAINSYTNDGDLRNVNWGKVLNSGIAGAISGGLAASGAGIVAQRVVNGTISALDSISQSIYDREPIGKATVKAIVSGGIGALTADKGMNNSTMKTLRSANNAAKKTLKQSSLHPAVKRTANNAIKSWKKYSRSQYGNMVFDTALYGWFSWSSGKVIDYAG